MSNYEITVCEQDAGMKIVDFLIRRARFSVTLVKKVKYGNVRVNGEVVTMRRVLCAGDLIEVNFPSEQSENVEPIYAPLDVVYEDEHILVVNKSVNMPTHPSRGNSLVTLGNAVAYYLGEPCVFRSINRLDRDTSGLVLIAKNQYSAALLGKCMKNREIKKKYLALVRGVPTERRGRIDAPIAREAEGEIRRVVREDGKSAITDYEVVRVRDDGNSVCKIELHTGRTHQIRVHFAHIGHPLVNDFLYGERECEGTYSLHCCELSFPHPVSGEMMCISNYPNF